MYHPKLIGFKQFFTLCRERSTDSLEFTASIVLPFQVQPQIFGKFNLGWAKSDVRVVYVELRGHEVHYGTIKDEKSFEIC